MLFLALSFSACSRQSEHAVDNVIVTVNGSAITEDDLALFMDGGHAVRETPEVRARMIEELVNQELLYQQGLKLGLGKDAKYRNQVTIMEMRLREFKRAEMARQVASTKIAASVNITEEDAQRYYRQNEPMITTDLRLFILRFRTEDEARSAYEKITAGATFETVAGQLRSMAALASTSDWDYGYSHLEPDPRRMDGFLFQPEQRRSLPGSA